MGSAFAWLVLLLLAASLLVIGLQQNALGLIGLGVLLAPLVRSVGLIVEIMAILGVLFSLICYFAYNERLNNPEPDTRALERYKTPGEPVWPRADAGCYRPERSIP